MHDRPDRGGTGRSGRREGVDAWVRCQTPRLELLFPSIADVAVLSVGVSIAKVRVDVRCTAAGASCPGCGAWSAQVHGSCLRFPPMFRVRATAVLQLRLRRFTYRGRWTWTPHVRRADTRPDPKARPQRTEQPRSPLAALGLALAGRAGSRLADIVGAPASRSTVLPLVDELPEPEVTAPRVVGVDECLRSAGGGTLGEERR